MSNFFSCIVTRKADVLFCELDAHDEVVNRSGLSDDLTQFLRVVYDPNERYLVDSKTIPEWYERKAALIEHKVLVIYKKLFPFWEEYDKVCRVADAKLIEGVKKEWGRFVEYKEHNRSGGVEGIASQSDEDNIGIQLRFGEFVGFEEAARAVFKSDVSIGMKRYKEKVSLIEGYLKEKKEGEGQS